MGKDLTIHPLGFGLASQKGHGSQAIKVLQTFSSALFHPDTTT